jgi:hypothetical protein
MLRQSRVMYCCATLMCQLKEEQQLKQIAQQVADEAQAKNAALEQQVCLCKRVGRYIPVLLSETYTGACGVLAHPLMYGCVTVSAAQAGAGGARNCRGTERRAATTGRQSRGMIANSP